MGKRQQATNPGRTTAKDKTYILLRLSAMGDVAMTLPYVYRLAREYPQSRVCMVTTPFHSRLLTPKPENLEVKPLDTATSGGMIGCIRMALELHRAYPGATVIDLHDVIRTRVIRYTMSMLGHPTHSIRKPRRRRKLLLRRRPQSIVPREVYVPQMTRVYERTLHEAGLEKVQGGWSPRWETERRKRREEKIGLAPYAKHKAKILPQGRLLELIERLHLAFPTYRIILYGAPGKEREANELLARQYPQYLSGSRAPTLEKELEEIAALKVMISMDSANQHIARWVGTPTVSLWGGTHPAAGFIPWGASEDDCIGHDMECRPCSIYGEKPCKRGDYACLHLVDLKKVVERTKQIIGNPQVKDGHLY